MKLYVEPMDAVLVEVDAGGRVRLENEAGPRRRCRSAARSSTRPPTRLKN